MATEASPLQFPYMDIQSNWDEITRLASLDLCTNPFLHCSVKENEPTINVDSMYHMYFVQEWSCGQQDVGVLQRAGQGY